MTVKEILYVCGKDTYVYASAKNHKLFRVVLLCTKSTINYKEESLKKSFDKLLLRRKHLTDTLSGCVLLYPTNRKCVIRRIKLNNICDNFEEFLEYTVEHIHVVNGNLCITVKEIIAEEVL